jgi:hypothetical protein
MSMTALDLIKLNSADDVVGLLEENQDIAPELSAFNAYGAPGDKVTTVVRTSFPEGAFKDAGAGVLIGKSNFKTAEYAKHAYENPLQEAEDIAKKHRKGVEGFLAISASGALTGMSHLCGRQIWYGATSPGDSKGHPGLADTATLVVNAGGDQATAQGSVYFVVMGDENVSLVLDEDNMVALGDWQKQLVTISGTIAAPKKAMAYVNSLVANIGLQQGTKKRRGGGFTTATTSKTATPSPTPLTIQALSLFPTGTPMNRVLCFMNRTRRQELWTSRITTEVKAPAMPTETQGIPIIVTDSLTDTEAVVS